MKKLKKIISIISLVLLCTISNTQAQVKLEDIIGSVNLDQLLGQAKILQVKKGFNPVFNLGDYQINKVGLLGEKLKGIGILGDILGKKRVEDINKLYKGYKTGLVIYKVLAAAGTTVAVVSTVKGLSDKEKFASTTVKTMLYPALTSVVTGVVTKLITKKASYKAVDMFNGVVKNAVKDIFSVKPASSTLGVGLYVKL